MGRVKTFDYNDVESNSIQDGKINVGGISWAVKKGEEKMTKDQRRLVEVFIVDPDKQVPIEEAILY